MAAGSLTLGGNLSIAIGPLGRNGEAMGSMNTSGKMAAMFGPITSFSVRLLTSVQV
jgi:SH3 domain-containing YSC84-like protein 1